MSVCCMMPIQDAVLLWMRDTAARDAVVVRQALTANDLRGATEVICSRTPSQIQTFKKIYHALYGSYLEHDLERHASGDHKKVPYYHIFCLSNW